MDPDGRVARSGASRDGTIGDPNAQESRDWPGCATQVGGCPLSAPSSPSVSGTVVSSGDGKGTIASDGDLTLKMGELLSATIGPNGARGSISVPAVTLKYDDNGKVSSNVRLGPGELILAGKIGEGVSKLGYDIKGNSFILQAEGNGMISYKLTGQLKIPLGKFSIKLRFPIPQASGKFNANPLTAVSKWQPHVANYFDRYDAAIRASEGAPP